MALDLKAEVDGLLAQLMARAKTIEDVRDTVEMTAMVREIALPIIDPDAPPSYVPAMARAILLGAVVGLAARRQPHAA